MEVSTVKCHVVAPSLYWIAMSKQIKDDDSSDEGCEFRSLFRPDSSSRSCSSCNSNDLSRQLEGIVRTSVIDHHHEIESPPPPSLQTHRYMHVMIQQQEIGGSIAQRLWPAAERLAEYILNNKQALFGMLQDETTLSILELGAGVGLTGLELASQLPARVIMTDLSDALPLLQSNTLLNQEQFVLGHNAVQVQALEWGNQSHAQQALAAIALHSDKSAPLLIIGSDCVYWECLHEPLELALFHILSEAPPGSMCLLAGMRRWKSDTKFYKMLGKKTASKTHRLAAKCIDETIKRTESAREITRIYKVQWLAK